MPSSDPVNKECVRQTRAPVCEENPTAAIAAKPRQSAFGLKPLLLIVVAGCVSGFLWLVSRPADAQDKARRQGQGGIPFTNSIGTFPTRFPDYNRNFVPAPDEYDGPLFRLSQDFPTRVPPVDPALKPIFDIPFRDGEAEATHFLLAVRDYCFEGNLEVDWQGQDNPVRKWYHVPWQHWGMNGREAIHGLTQEATAQPFQLGPDQDKPRQSYAVGMYNASGGYTIGQVWSDPYNPNLNAGKFEVGTVVAKILFTQASPEEVAYLQNPIQWQAMAQISSTNQTRTLQTVNLIQMDVMVRVPDELQTPTGWVVGNYCYNGAVGSANPWDNLVPNGLQWGDDPTVKSDPRQFNSKGEPFPPATVHNADLKQTIINASTDLPPQHLGWGGRLNGPLDYYNSSCMSCHATAQYKQVAPLNPAFGTSYAVGSEGWMYWFRNVKCGEVFGTYPPTDQQVYTMDFSLQLAISLANFEEWQQLDGPDPAPRKTRTAPQALAARRSTPTQVFKIRRDGQQP